MLKPAMGWIGDEICEESVKFFKVEKMNNIVRN